MEEALVSLLLENSGLAALVGTRVYWARRPQAGKLPSVILTRIGGTRDYTMEKASGLVETRVQADIWGSTYGEAKGAARALIAAVNGYSDITFQGIFLEGERDSFEVGPGSADLFRVSIDLIIWHLEEI